jgi:hypothetical protein
MQVFTTDRKAYLTNELKSWAWTVAFVLLLYFGFQLFSPRSAGSFLIGVLLLKLGDRLTQYHVKAIQIDKENYKINFRLNSIMSGQKIKTYDLRQVTAELTESKTWTTKSSPALKIYLPKKESFRIDSRYGFSAATLTAINNALKISNNAVITQ